MEQEKLWSGKWIWTEGVPRSGYRNDMVCFRRTFDVPSPGCELKVEMTADSRYQLYLNGRRVCVGPAKGDDHTHYYETLDLSNALRAGKNVLAVRVLHYASGGQTSGPGSIRRSPWGGLLLDGFLTAGDGSILESLHTDNRWICRVDPSYKLEYESFMSGNWLGGIERIDGALHPHGWERIEYDDRNWQRAVPFMETMSKYGALNPWNLTPRTIPFLYEQPTAFTGIKRFGGSSSVQADDLKRVFCAPPDDVSQSALALEPGTATWVELDAGELTTGYIRIEFTGGRGSRIRIQCSECYERPNESIRDKHVRDDCSEGQVLLGDSDIYTPLGGMEEGSGEIEVYEPFWFRTFRFVRLEIETGEEMLTLHRFFYRETGYPLVPETSFRCSDASMDPLWTISLNTLRRCMHETYEDCPYYEQLQYTMDTRLQILYNYSISRDDRLARKALRHFHYSQLPSGILQSCYPSAGQVIPGFALHWVYMLYDHYLYYGDLELVKEYRATMDGVLGWFDRYLTSDGLVGPAPDKYWSYIDWVKEWHSGVPTAAQHGPITIISMMYATALELAAELNKATGRAEVAQEYVNRADQVREAIRRLCWSEARGLYRDGPEVEMYSQHVQIWAVLSGTSMGSEARAIMTEALNNPQLSKASYSMQFFFFRALSEAGMYDRAYSMWKDWHHMVAMHMTTWAEDDIKQRSDCHGWGAAPLYEFPSEILGVKPDSPGYTRIVIAPKPGKLNWAEGSVITGLGPVSVHWRVNDGNFQIEIDGPEGAELKLVLPDGRTMQYPSAAGVREKCQL